MKTVMMDLIERINRNERMPHNWQEVYIERERQQIEISFEAGEKNIDFTALHGQGKLSDSKKYYSETFKNP